MQATYPQPEGQLADCFNKYSKEVGTDALFGELESLERFGGVVGGFLRGFVGGFCGWVFKLCCGFSRGFVRGGFKEFCGGVFEGFF